MNPGAGGGGVTVRAMRRSVAVIMATKLRSSFPLSSSYPLDSDKRNLMTKAVDSRCRAFQLAIDVLGRPWNALILTVLLAGPLRFSELGERAEGPGDKVLSARLKDLEERGLVLRHVAHGPPVRVTYELSDKGRAFGQVAEAIERWGQKLALDEKPRRDRRA